VGSPTSGQSCRKGVYPRPEGEARSDSGIGLWLGGGVSRELRKHSKGGIDGRLSGASVSLPLGSGDALVSVNSGSVQLDAIAGYGR